MSIMCRLCEQLLSTPSFAPGICQSCADTIRMRPMPAPRRRPAPCGRCNGTRFARALAREYSDGSHPMTVTQAVQTVGRLVRTGKDVYGPSPELGAGALEIYTCLGRGFVEWYCQDPEKIPIGPEHMTDLVDYTSESPYR